MCQKSPERLRFLLAFAAQQQVDSYHWTKEIMEKRILWNESAVNQPKATARIDLAKIVLLEIR